MLWMPLCLERKHTYVNHMSVPFWTSYCGIIGSSAAKFSEAKALLMCDDVLEPKKCSRDDNALARKRAHASHELRASLTLDRSRPSMDQVGNATSEFSVMQHISWTPCIISPTASRIVDPIRCSKLVGNLLRGSDPILSTAHALSGFCYNLLTQLRFTDKGEFPGTTRSQQL